MSPLNNISDASPTSFTASRHLDLFPKSQTSFPSLRRSPSLGFVKLQGYILTISNILPHTYLIVQYSIDAPPPGIPGLAELDSLPLETHKVADLIVND